MHIKELFESLDKRFRPEYIARLVSEELDLNSPAIQKITKSYNARTSMSEDFKRPSLNLDVASLLFDIIPDDFSLTSIDNFIIQAEKQIGIKPGHTDFKNDRLNKANRKSIGVDISKRQYNKMFRLAARLERKRNKFAVESDKREFQQVSKSALACKIQWEDFQDPNTACFIAYYAAKCNLRSVFTNQAQHRPFDELCEELFARCEASEETTNWWAIAHVFPDKRVLQRLTDEQKGILLGKWHDILFRLSGVLKLTWMKSKINRETMIVKRGDDSSTWNVMAGAWNKARNNWIAILYALEAEELLESLCLGKVLRLMAADVAYWHKSTGGKLEPDTAVWNEVPLPWEVLQGEVSCTKLQVENICKKFGINPEEKGWTSSLKTGKVHEFRPTPELVHGVAVGSPGLASFLKKMGAFSGKQKQWG